MLCGCASDPPRTVVLRDPSLPAPFSEGAGEDDGLAAFDSLSNGLLRGIPIELIEAVGTDEFEAWLTKTRSNEIVTKDIGAQANLYAFLRDFEIDGETVRALLTEEMEFWEEHHITPNFTPQQIDALIGGDREAVAQSFANDLALVQNGDIFTPEWLYYASEEQYAEYGIPKDRLAEKAEAILSLPFTEEAAEALARKIEAYTGTVVSLGLPESGKAVQEE